MNFNNLEQFESMNDMKLKDRRNCKPQLSLLSNYDDKKFVKLHAASFL